MTFHFGVTEYVLFDAWHVTSAGGMVASCLGLFLIALLYEGLKYKRWVSGRPTVKDAL